MVIAMISPMTMRSNAPRNSSLHVGSSDLTLTAPIHVNTACGHARPGLGRLVAVELRKIVDTRAGFWLQTATVALTDRKSTRLNSSHVEISYAVFCLKKKTPAVFYAVLLRS